jgi:endonuclease/exonuclease/phosphatase family metal-dependent hydrolase
MSATSHRPRESRVPESGAVAAELRVLHWNVHSWRDAAGAPNIDAVAALIRETRPHAVSLVEVNEPWGAPSALAKVADECGYSWVFGPVLEFGADPSARGYGNALLTRVPVTAVQQWRVFAPPRLYDGSEPAEPRSVVLARLPFAGATLWVGSTHFPAGDAGARKAAALELRRVTGHLARPWLVCGDFNAAPDDCFADRGDLLVSPDPARPTFPATHPKAAIDYCIAFPGIFLESEVLRAEGSDHLPLLTIARSAPVKTRGLHRLRLSRWLPVRGPLLAARRGTHPV